MSSDYEYREFPKWKYKGKQSKVVNSPEEEEELGEGWVDSPADAAVEEEAVDPEGDQDDDDDEGDGEGETVPPDAGGEEPPKKPKRASKKKA